MLSAQGWPPGPNCEVGVCLQNLPASFFRYLPPACRLGRAVPSCSWEFHGAPYYHLGCTALPSTAHFKGDCQSPSPKSNEPGLGANPRGQIREMYLSQWQVKLNRFSSVRSQGL